MKGPGDGVGVVPFIVGVTVSLEPLAGCSPKRRRAAFKVASRVPVDVRGESPAVGSEGSDSVKEPEVVSEVEEVESEADALVDCPEAGVGTSPSTG